MAKKLPDDNVDWNNIAAEYITTDTSQRKLQEKYGVSMRTLQDHAKREEWAKKKKEYATNSVAKCVEVAITHDANRMARIQNVSDSILEAIEQAVNELNICVARNVKKHKEIKYNANGKPVKEDIEEIEEYLNTVTAIDVQKLKWLTDAIKNLKDIQELYSALDKARIKKIEAETTKLTGNDIDNEGTGVVILADVEDSEGGDIVEI